MKHLDLKINSCFDCPSFCNMPNTVGCTKTNEETETMTSLFEQCPLPDYLEKTCGSCRHLAEKDLKHYRVNGCLLSDMIIRETDFCSFWEAREEKRG